MDEIKVAEAQVSPSQVAEIGGLATADAGTGGAAQFAVLSADERQTLRATLAAAHPNTVPELIGGETVGEIMFRGNITMKGYLKNPSATEEAFAGGGPHWGPRGDRA